ncbi:nucleoside-diphosphate-sugar epimerase [Kribbella pratensis]|uniref:Nucleoside-diphosphate-sugar epimerase n=2 Tax=Kribbella pratensis TaxID=2512112 RepID=A0A4R8BLR2_9ACTN|nr:nucleoside-diphosphate-sugar epimerase [Kribbella pratensis]
MRQMRIWVSGARGKLGAEVCRQLIAAGHEVIEADLTGPDPVDLMSRDAVARSLRGADAIVHCAGIASPENIEPVRLFEINTITTFNALEEAWTQGIRTAVLASSGSIYGTAWSPDEIGTPDVPIDENTELRYVDPYALTKDALERVGQTYARRGVQVTALRFHWILTPDEVRRYIADAPPEDNRRNLWGYVDLREAARACTLSLEPRTHARYATLVIAAEDTGRPEPTTDLLSRYSPHTKIRTPLTGTASLYNTTQAATLIHWTHQSTWRNH